MRVSGREPKGEGWEIIGSFSALSKYGKTVHDWIVHIRRSKEGWVNIKLVAHNISSKTRRKNFALAYNIIQQRYADSREFHTANLYPDLLQKLTEVIEEYLHA